MPVIPTLMCVNIGFYRSTFPEKIKLISLIRNSKAEYAVIFYDIGTIMK